LQSDTNQIVLQLFETVLEQQRNLCDLARNDLLLIELAHGAASPEALAAAASTVRSTLYSVDALSDKIRRLDEQARRH